MIINIVSHLGRKAVGTPVKNYLDRLTSELPQEDCFDSINGGGKTQPESG